MKAVRLIAALAYAVVIAALFIIGPNRSWAAATEANIDHWLVMWIPDGEQPGASPPADGEWIEAKAGSPLVDLPAGAQGAWIRLQVPPTDDWQRPGLLVRRLYGLELAAFREGELLFESKRDFDFHLNRLLLPLGSYDRTSNIDVRILTTGTRAGFITNARVGEFAPLEESYIRRELPDLMLGGSISFLALIMLICSSYLNRRQRSSWISLCLIALTIGTLISVYSPMLYIYYKSYANLFLSLFDLSMFVLFPALSYYVDEVLGNRFRFFTRFRKWQAGFSVFCFLAFIAYKATNERYYDLYYLLTNPILGSLILVQLADHCRALRDQRAAQEQGRDHFIRLPLPARAIRRHGSDPLLFKRQKLHSILMENRGRAADRRARDHSGATDIRRLPDAALLFQASGAVQPPAGADGEAEDHQRSGRIGRARGPQSAAGHARLPAASRGPGRQREQKAF
ncbi:hypothetical protein [Cohnella rhizosphaerae]|uniref:Uncharacterized protein n=1 Tax=Cohnella rhizosphaerae TaxID=1457232 RepID=A0A9X4QVG9_9BACL|nr:hypothetical protein [Cohnella rhizosphaerae]MDG0811467.1 hypothetical protein [Cohnella rhizosphaerae]